jgi:hypothetical protein
LGEISPNKRLATFGQFLKMKEEAKIFVLHISTEKSFFIILPKKKHFGQIFIKNSSRHPGESGFHESTSYGPALFERVGLLNTFISCLTNYLWRQKLEKNLLTVK